MYDFFKDKDNLNTNEIQITFIKKTNITIKLYSSHFTQPLPGSSIVYAFHKVIQVKKTILTHIICFFPINVEFAPFIALLLTLNNADYLFMPSFL